MGGRQEGEREGGKCERQGWREEGSGWEGGIVEEKTVLVIIPAHSLYNNVCSNINVQRLVLSVCHDHALSILMIFIGCTLMSYIGFLAAFTLR